MIKLKTQVTGRRLRKVKERSRGGKHEIDYVSNAYNLT